MTIRGLRRRSTLALAIAGATSALLAAVGAAGGGGEAVAQAQRPNIVVVMTDDQDVRSLRVMDAVRRQLAGQGTSFANAFASYPLCCPSRATFFTGQYAHNHGVMDNVPPAGGVEAFNPRRTVPTSLRASGYRTALIGKYLNGYRGPGIPPGWSDWHVLARFTNRMYGYTLNENGRPRSYGSRPADYQTDVLARKASAFVGRAAGGSKPFFLMLSTGAPHSESGREPGQLNPRPAPRHVDRFRTARLPRPPSFNEDDVSDKPAFVRGQPKIDGQRLRTLVGRYRGRLGSLLAVDDAVSRLVGRLRATGELDNTVILYTSDNGFLHGEHRLTAKTKLYEESARVPLLIRGPGIPRGVTRGQLVANIDLAPTILDVAGTQPGRVMDGLSLLPLARSPSVAADRDILLENRESIAVRSPGFMYAEHRGGESELYELSSDPLQLESRHDDPSMAATESLLEQRLRELEDCAGASCR